MNAGVVLGHVTGGDDPVLLETILCSQLLDRVSVATQHQDPLILVLVQENLEGSMRLDKLVLLNLHHKSLANALSMTTLGHTAAIGEEDKGDGVCLKGFESLFRSRDGDFSSDKDTIDVEGKGEVMGGFLEIGDGACLGLSALQREPLKMETTRRAILVARVTVRHGERWVGLVWYGNRVRRRSTSLWKIDDLKCPGA